MINKISVNSANSNKQQYPKNQPNFGDGGLGFILSGIQLCEKYPMVNVSVLDLSTAIIPRTIIEGQTNVYGGFEAFRRESSGLIINCIIPSFIVLAIAKSIQGSIMGGDSKMADCWANEETIKTVTNYWNEAKGKNDRERVENTIRNLLKDTEGVDGTELKSFKDLNFEDSVKKLADNVFNQKYDKKAVKAAYGKIIGQTHISENIKIKGAAHLDKKTGKMVNEYLSQSLGDVMSHTPKILRELVSGKFPDSATFVNKAKKLVTAKSLGGLAIILPLAISAQPINRWITEKASGVKGAPIYKDYENSKNRELNSQQKSELFKQKIVSISSMIGVALLSIMKMPSLGMLKSITQFKSIFPSMDQARIISTATFASRMGASQDKNDLREATVRDITLFASFYFLGDYVAKGIASLIQKTKGIKLINVLEKTPDNAGPLKKFWYWAKHTALKSSDEVYGATAKATKHAKDMRSVCQLGNIAFSLVVLGILIPKMNRKKTDKEHAKELELQKMEMAKKSPKIEKAA